MEIPKAAMRATNNAMRGYIPHSGIVSAGAKILAGQQSKEKKQDSSKKKKRVRLTEAGRGSGKPVLCQNVTVSQAAKKLFDYEETGLAPYEVRVLMEREKALAGQVKKMQDW